MKKILVPTDFSECAEAATEVALEIALRVKAQLYFLHLHPGETKNGHASMNSDSAKHKFHQPSGLLGNVRQALSELVSRAERQGVDAKPILVFDESKDQISTHAQAFEIDLIVMGSKGAHGLREIFIGSNAQYVAKRSSIPILVVKDRPDSPGFENIIFASTFVDDVKSPLNFIVDFSKLWDAKIHLLFVNTPSNFMDSQTIITKMNTSVEGMDATFTFNTYNAPTEEAGISEFAKSIDADLVSLVTNRKSGFEEILSPDLSEKMVNHAAVPVLINNCVRDVEPERVQQAML